MVRKKVYLAGPISGLSYEEATNGWRKEFSLLVPDHIDCYSPMRNKKHLNASKVIDGSPDSYTQHPMSTDKGIFDRDHNDVKTAEAVVVNLLGAKSPSIGTIFEIAWANQYRIPTVGIIEKDGILTDGSKNPHWHAFIKQALSYLTQDLEEAAFVTMSLLTPGI